MTCTAWRSSAAVFCRRCPTSTPGRPRHGRELRLRQPAPDGQRERLGAFRPLRDRRGQVEPAQSEVVGDHRQTMRQGGQHLDPDTPTGQHRRQQHARAGEGLLEVGDPAADADTRQAIQCLHGAGGRGTGETELGIGVGVEPNL